MTDNHPHPDLPLDTVLEGDCVELMAELPANSVDVIFADPPYNLQLQQPLWRPNMTRVDAVTDSWDQFESFAAYDAFTRAWLSACRRVLKDNGTLWVIGSYHNIYRVGALLLDLDYWILNEVAWVKTNPMPNFHGTRFTNAHETLIWAQKERGQPYTFNYHQMKALNGGKQMRSDWVIPICSGGERLKVNGEKAHSTQKPEALLYRVILSSSNPGDVVLDPFFGTGTTGAVARRLHRYWLGIERDAQYAQLARQRIAAVEPGPYSAKDLTLPDPRRRPRVPFSELVERGLIQPGQRVYFRDRDEAAATVTADGRLRYDDQIGSIHQIGRAIQGTPINGWQHWYVDIPGKARRVPIDQLRERVRQRMAGSDPGADDA
jgi:site-specific DNA-methyltransferase (adenine-specific)